MKPAQLVTALCLSVSVLILLLVIRASLRAESDHRKAMRASEYIRFSTVNADLPK